MKVSKCYSLKKSKSNEIISFTFPFIDIRNRKMTPCLGESATPRLGDSPTRRVVELASRWEKKDSIKIVFSHTKVIFSPPKSAKKDQNMTILDYSCGLQSSLYTKNHCFTLRALIFCPKKRLLRLFSNCSIYRKFINKKGASDKSSEDINVAESVLMNVAPLYF
jgi:hypothetical protein